MNKFLLLCCTFLLSTVYISEAQLSGPLSDARPLSGVLPDVIEKGVYLVTGDVFVSPGSAVSVQAGTIFLFREFSGIHVQGVLYVNGLEEEMVVFTSVNDSLFVPDASVKPAPFDWNGIDIYEGAPGTTFKHCRIQYSVYGIRSQTEHVKLDDVIFTNNGKSDFSVKNERKEVTIPFSYSFGFKPLIPEPSQALVDTVRYTDTTKNSQSEKPSMGIEPSTVEKKRKEWSQGLFSVERIGDDPWGDSSWRLFRDQIP